MEGLGREVLQSVSSVSDTEYDALGTFVNDCESDETTTRSRNLHVWKYFHLGTYILVPDPVSTDFLPSLVLHEKLIVAVAFGL